MDIAIAGAGSIGCFIGALLARGGHRVTLLGRSPVLESIRSEGLSVTDFAGLDARIGADHLLLATGPDGLAGTDLILVTVKSGGTAGIAAEIAEHAPPGAPVISLQNGLTNPAILREYLPGRDIRAGMVAFNVVPRGPARFHRAVSGDIVIAAGAGGLAAALTVPDLTIQESDRIEAVQRGKLLLNLNNALNALSGLTLRQQLMDRGWRRLMADQMDEALAVLDAAGLDTVAPTPLPTWLVPHVLRLPTPVFSRLASRMLTVDPEARTSMAYDLAAGRSTEIDTLQGEIARLARSLGIATPICDRVRQVIGRASPDDPGVAPADLRPGTVNP